MQVMETKQRLLLEPTAVQPRVARTATKLFARPLNRALGLKALDAHYAATSLGKGPAAELRASLAARTAFDDDSCESSRHDALDSSDGCAAFLDRALAELQVTTELTPNLDAVPKEGPVVLVANHPYGGIEGLALVRELMRVRPDVKVMANRLLARVVELDECSIWVNPFGGEKALRSNVGALRDALRFVRGGGALLVFPAGEVSHLRARDRRVLDPEWQPSIARLVMAAQAQVVPLFVEGRNSALFQLAGLISPLLRTALLPREMLARRRSTLRVRVGRALGPAEWGRYRDPEQLIGFLRLATYALAGHRAGASLELDDRTQVAAGAASLEHGGSHVAHPTGRESKEPSLVGPRESGQGATGAMPSAWNDRSSAAPYAPSDGQSAAPSDSSSTVQVEPNDRSRSASSKSTARSSTAPLAAAADPAQVAAELAALPEGRRLHTSGPFEVHCAYASEVPTVMHELGRLREETFRAVGEGTGRALDLDAYDDFYRHLVLWHTGEQRIVGAYRMGATDDILAATGVLGLYTRSLFRYSARFVKDLGPALELGRAFVVRDFQKQYLPLMLLWQGIGRFLARNPRYVTLFGPVSISADYSPVSRYVMAKRLLSATTRRPGRLPRALMEKASRLAESASRSRKKPTGNVRLPRRGVAGVDLESLADLARTTSDLSNLIAGIDPSGQGLPVLLRQYLKLNGRVLAFNLDESFGNTLDALLVVDLRDTAPRDLQRILGAEGYAVFAAEHGAPRGGAEEEESDETAA